MYVIRGKSKSEIRTLSVNSYLEFQVAPKHEYYTIKIAQYWTTAVRTSETVSSESDSPPKKVQEAHNAGVPCDNDIRSSELNFRVWTRFNS